MMFSSRSNVDRIWTIFAFVAFLLTILLLLVGCGKDESEAPSPSIPNVPSSTTRVLGQVVDVSGTALPGVMVLAGSTSTVTDAQGVFLLNEAPADQRVVVRCQKAGFFNAVHGAVADLGGTTRVRVVMHSVAPDFTGLSASAPQDLLDPSGLRLLLPANGLVTASGALHTGSFAVAVAHFGPDDPAFDASIPGGDLACIADGAQQQLYSYGMASVRITDEGGNELQLGNGASAVLRFPIATTQSGEAPSTMTLWHLNEETGLWEQEGEAQREGNDYVGVVQHFSTWNVDANVPRAKVTGVVRDCAGIAVEGLQVRVGQSAGITGMDGRFQVFVPAGFDVEVEVQPNALGLTAAPIPLGGLSAGSVQELDVVVACPAYVVGNISCPSGGVNGFATLIWAGGSHTIGLGGAGAFRIAAPPNGQQATLRLVNSSGGVQEDVSVTLPSFAGGEASVGNIVLCSGQPGSGYQSGCVLNGDGYGQQTVTINSTALLSIAVHYLGDDLTDLFFIDTGGETQLFIEFPGAGTGNCMISEGSGACFLSLIIDGRNYFSYDLQITVNQYGGVGGDVQGVFSGTMVRYDAITGDEAFVTVSNGYFRAKRGPDEP